MRSQGCTIQQALTLEATAVVKQAVVLAKRRGHAQVTPLHVAHTMLSISSGLLRAACLQAHSHPLQCRALELCFNVALNRLPASASSGPMMLGGPHHHHGPTLANALVAAFKRAQAHQRRGSVENQQQPLLAVKIELDQLIISILDDPSVSRVMREAGFSSTLVKSKVELATNSMENNNIKTKEDDQSQGLTKMGKLEPRPLDRGTVRNEDVMSVIASLMNISKKGYVVVGECIETLGAIASEVMCRVENDRYEGNLKEVKFFKILVSSFVNLSREEVEQRVEEIKCLVKGNNNKGMVVYLGDLKWTINSEFRVINRMDGNENYSNNLVEQYQPRSSSCYCPIEHIMVEIEKLVSGYGGEMGRLWILGIATHQTYMRCKNGDPSLETILDLHCIAIPSQSSLSLSLLPDSDLHNHSITSKKAEIGSSWLMLKEGGGGVVDLESQNHKFDSCISKSTTVSLPPWLQQCKDEKSRKASDDNIHNDKDNLLIKDLPNRWSSTSPYISYSPSSSSFERTLSFSSISPSSSTSNFSYEHSYSKSHPNHQSFEPTFTLTIQDHKDDHNPHEHQRHFRTFVSSNPNSTPTSTSSSEIMDQMESSPCVTPRFKDYNEENLKTICNALEQKVPHQKGAIFDIASTLLQCRAGMTRRKLGFQEREIKEETWFFFQGVDTDAKEKIAKELARLNFGSEDKFVSLGLSSFSSTRGDSSEDSRNKRIRDEQSCTYIERFAREVSQNPHRVFFVEDIEQVDYSSQMGIKKAIERGRIYTSGKDVGFGDAIIILSCERYRSRSRACSPSTNHKIDDQPQECHQKVATLEDATSPSISLDLNLSISDNHGDSTNGFELPLVDEIGLLASVDRCIMFESSQDS